MTTRTSFTTSFGREIPFIEGYLEAHARNLWEDQDWSQQESDDFLSTPMSYSSFRKDLFSYAFVMDFLRSHGISGDGRWGSTLDIGGREATVARLITAEGKADHVETIDLKPYYRRLSTKLFQERLRDVRAPKKWGIRVPRRLAGLLNDRYYNWAESQPREFGFVPHKGFGWDIRMTKAPELGTYTVADFNTHEFGRTFDFISAMSCIDYFDPDFLFKKISSLLNPGGIFVFFIEYFWFPVTTTDVVGHFPYVTQRLTREDFIRYLEENFPADEAAWLLKRRDYYQKGKQMTPMMFANVADEHGLSVVGEHRCMTLGDRCRRTSLPPRVMDQFDNATLKEVLEDIRQFRDDVQLADLKTGNMMMAFEKRAPRKPDLREKIKEVPKLR
jgi:SAM-dependent methyltransferase